MDEQKQRPEQIQQTLRRMQEVRRQIQIKHLWSRSPLDWVLLWQIGKGERLLRESLAANEQPQTNTNDEDGCDSFSFSVLQLAPSIPVQFTARLPFSWNRINIGKDGLGRLRKQVDNKPNDAQAHITLAAHLLSEQPLLPVHASEAADNLRLALQLMPPDEERNDKVQHKAMVHKFLGDALIVVGERVQAREHWEQAIDLDPVRPPYGFSGPAQEMLNKYPLPLSPSG